jgi:glucose/arabinose dehydrogenase
LRGSWNRSTPTGYKVIFLKFENENDTTAQYVADFVTGFQPTNTSPQSIIWGRPVGIAADHRGNLYLGSDDITQCIVIISPVKSKK